MKAEKESQIKRPNSLSLHWLVLVFFQLYKLWILLCLGLDLGWIRKHQDQLQRLTTAPFLEELLTHLRKMDVLSLAEESKIKEAGRLQDQVNMLTTFIISKDTQGSDALQGFIESSDSPVAQLIVNHGKGLEMGFDVCVVPSVLVV